MKKKHVLAVVSAGAVLVAGAVALGIGIAGASPSCTLTNPITAGADPSIWYRGGTYYLVQSDGARSISLRAAATLDGLSSAAPQIIWTSPTGTDHSAETWAPEIEYLDGRWIIYFAAATDKGSDPATNDTHRVFALAASTSDPTGPWSFVGKIADSSDQWAIDPTVFSWDGDWYMLWSGTPANHGGSAPQQIYIAHMSDPLHIDQHSRRRISSPDHTWETSVQAIEEGPEAWIGPNKTLTIVYNANASWTTSYALGELVYGGGDLTNSRSYAKKGPVFTSGGGVYGPGGESVPVPGADGINWNVYHAKTLQAQGWDDREIFAQPVPWNSDGTPDFGTATGFTSYNEATEKACS